MSGLTRAGLIDPRDDPYLVTAATRDQVMAARGHLEALVGEPSNGNDQQASNHSGPPSPPVWLTAREAARRSGIANTTFKRWMASGLLPVEAHQVGPGGRRYISSRALEAWLASWRG
jgi:Helix-turn-helix domain